LRPQAGLFSAVSSAFVIDVQSNLQPDSSERSEAYLRAILLSLNRSIVPSEVPAPPPVWNGPPAEIVTTSNLLYASLLMSLLAAFVAMLGKQWLSRYLRHAGGSMIERCGDRQRKLNGLEKWPFRLFIESLPIMLQIALLLLSCGLSRYVWSVNISVARVVISFTVLGVIFYVGIVIAGASSYECPFQTPASTALRALRGKSTTRRLLASLSPPRIISFVCVTWRDVRRELTSRYRHIHEAVVNLRPWEISFPTISGMATDVGYQTIILFLRVDRAFGNTKHRLVRGVRRCTRAMLLSIIHEGADHQPHASQPQDGFLVPARNIASLRKRNADNARCVSWIICNITDPEAIDSAIRLAGTIRWFDGDVDVDPPFDLIVSTFEACFDPTRKPYPGMSDRAYFSVRAILRIAMTAGLRSRECTFKYPIPHNYEHYRADSINEDLDGILRWLSRWLRFHGRIVGFPSGTPTHSMWWSNLHLDMIQADPEHHPHATLSMTKDTTPLSCAADVDIILSWYIYLGGPVQEETFWTDDKSYVVTPLLLLSA
jgi:hypothetical protein